jgi:hypothetical protein
MCLETYPTKARLLSISCGGSLLADARPWKCADIDLRSRDVLVRDQGEIPRERVESLMMPHGAGGLNPMPSFSGVDPC